MKMSVFGAVFVTLTLYSTNCLPAAESNAETSLIQVPGTWEDQQAGKYADLDGFAWYRCYVKVPNNWADMNARPLWRDSVTLSIEKLADAHEVYINGTRIGQIGKFPPELRKWLRQLSAL